MIVNVKPVLYNFLTDENKKMILVIKDTLWGAIKDAIIDTVINTIHIKYFRRKEEADIKWKCIGKEKFMENNYNDTVEIDIRDLLHTLVRRIWIIIIAGIAGALATGLINIYLITPHYTSTSKIYVINRQDETKTTYTDLQSGSQITRDFMILITSRPVLEQVIKQTGVTITPDKLAGMISVVNPQDTRIMEISVTDDDAASAKKLADSVADVSAEQLVRIMEIQKVNVVEYGIIPDTPTGRNIPRSFFLGGLGGVVIASAIIAVIHILNDNLKTAEDIECYLGITTLGMIPLEGNLNIKSRGIGHMRRKLAMASARIRYGGIF